MLPAPLDVFIGLLVVLCGVNLFWLARHDLSWWARRWLALFRHARCRPGERPASAPGAPTRFHALRILLAVSLLFFLGPLLIFLGLGL